MRIASWRRRRRGVGHPSSLNRNTIVRGNQLPFAVSVHPNVGQPVVVFVGFPFNCAFLVISPSHHDCVPVGVNFQV